MSTFAWIVISGLLMSAIALVGSMTLVLSESTLQRITLPLAAFAAGSLIGGAFFHMIPAGLAEYGNNTDFFLWLVAGFSTFFALLLYHRRQSSGTLATYGLYLSKLVGYIVGKAHPFCQAGPGLQAEARLRRIK